MNFCKEWFVPIYKFPGNKDSLATDYFSVSKTRLDRETPDGFWLPCPAYQLKGERKYLPERNADTANLIP